MDKNVIRMISAIVVSLTLLFVLYSQIDIDDILFTIGLIDPYYLLIAFMLYVGNYFFRSLRFYLLLEKKISLKDLFTVVCVHNMTNNIFPARTGELSYIYLLKKIHYKKIEEGIASLLIARFLDFVSIMVLFLMATHTIGSFTPATMHLIWIITFFMLSLIMLFVMFVYFGKKVPQLFRVIAIRLKLDNIDLISLLLDKTDGTIEKLQLLKNYEKTHLLKLIMVSLTIWLLMYSFNFLIVRAMNINLNFLLVVFATSFAIFTTVLPIQGIGGFGTLESGWVIGFITVGLSKDIAISSGLIYHTIILIYFLLLGIWGTMAIKKRLRNEQNHLL